MPDNFRVKLKTRDTRAWSRRCRPAGVQGADLRGILGPFSRGSIARVATVGASLLLLLAAALQIGNTIHGRVSRRGSAS